MKDRTSSNISPILNIDNLLHLGYTNQFLPILNNNNQNMYLKVFRKFLTKKLQVQKVVKRFFSRVKRLELFLDLSFFNTLYIDRLNKR